MGANLLVMGIAPALVAYGFYRLAGDRSHRFQLPIIAFSAWFSVMTGAFIVALVLWLSGTVSLRLVMPAMLGVHALIGIGEAVISNQAFTLSALSLIRRRSRPTLLTESSEAGGRGWIIGGMLMTLAVLVLAPFASASPDGLERVAEDLGFIGSAQSSSVEILPDYLVPALGDTNMSVIIAGLIGVIIVALLVILLAKALRPSRQSADTTYPT